MNNLVVFILAFLVIGSLVTSYVYADILPPKKQAKIGIANEKIVCETGMFKVNKVGTNSVACVKANNVYKLVAHGWAQPVDEKKLNEFISKLTFPSGQINKILVTPIKSDLGIQSPKVAVGSYDYVFEVCASSQDLVSPEVLIRSDSETKKFELAETITKNSCVTSATIIKAASPESISANLVSKGDLSEVISSAFAKVENLKAELANAKNSFGKETNNANKNQGNKIVDLRRQLNDARAELHRLYFILYSPVKSALPVENMSFSGTPIQGEAATIISVSPSISTSGTYDVVFEACAGQTQVRVPVIMITSDNQNVNVKLGDKIAPNTCQLTSTKITANDIESITINTAGTSISSNKVTELEEKIAELQNQLITSKNQLTNLVHNPDRPEDFNEQVTTQVEDITKLRNDIISAKAELSKILYQIYK